MASSNITVLTSITGGKDVLQEQPKSDARYVAFTDETKSKTWEIKEPPSVFVDPRRNSRIPKMCPHLFFDSEYTIWIDGNIKMHITPEEAVEKYLKDHDFAVFKHPSRDCLYEEAIVCARLRLDDPEKIIEQVKHYEDEGFAKHKGLCECGVILRRNTPKVQAFNNAWLAEYTRFSRRDQLSFPYVADKVGLRFNAIDAPWEEIEGKYMRDNAFEIVPHLTTEGNWNDPKNNG